MTDPKLKILVPPEASGQRLDTFLAEANLSGLSRSRIQALIKAGQVWLGGKETKPSHKVKVGEKIEIEIPPLQKTPLASEDIPLDIVFEDSDILVVNKPAGMVTHPALGNHSGTLVNALLFHCKDLSGVGGVERPGIVHRLDKETSGLLVVAKNDFAHHSLTAQLKDRTLTREYFAMVWGRLPKDKGEISLPIGRSVSDRKKMAVRRSKGKEAKTLYLVRESHALCQSLMVRLATGRTHQIRVHFSHLGHPLVGDPEYGGRSKWLNQMNNSQEKILAQKMLATISRQALHAQKLGLQHPRTGKYREFSSPLPVDITALLDLIENI